MIHNKFRYLLTLVALLAMTTGAWAQTALNVAELTIPDTWQNDNTALSTNDLPGYQAASRENAIAWTGAPDGYATLIFDVTGSEVKSADFYNGNYANDGSSSGLKHSTLYTWKNSASYRFFYTTAPAEPDVKVTISDDQTEASFEMPAFDATADYELVRDMGYKVAFSGVPTRARLAKDGNGKFHFVDGLTFQLLDNIDAANPKDITSAEGITFMVGEVVPFDFEGSTFYQLDKETLVPLADFLADAHLGTYAICAVASTGEYDGSFSSGRITLFQGYEVEVAAGEFATFYKDEPLYADTETSADAVLYTVSSVSADKAVLSSAITTAPSLTPLLVYNAGEQDNTFLLIPADAEPNEAVTVAPEFVGTLEATTIAASTEALNNYALNGKQFVWVKDAIEVGANKCWLQISNGEPTARGISIVFGEATGVNGVIGVKEVLGKPSDQGRANDDSWYDLSGRKVNAPTKKGIYLFNGRKVVVR